MRRAPGGILHKPWFHLPWTSARVLLLLAVGSVSTLLYLQDVTIATYLRVFFPLFGLYGLAVVSVFRKRPGSCSYAARPVVITNSSPASGACAPRALPASSGFQPWCGRSASAR